MKTHTFFKSLMTAILFLLVPWAIKATRLSGDVIYLQGEEWALLGKPIDRDSILFHQLMEFLPDEQREVVYMRFYQDLSFKEIAEQTGVSINTSLGRMRYAILNLRRMAEKNGVVLTVD